MQKWIRHTAVRAASTTRDLRLLCPCRTCHREDEYLGRLAMEGRIVGHETFQKLHGLGLRNAQLAILSPCWNKSYLR